MQRYFIFIIALAAVVVVAGCSSALRLTDALGLTEEVQTTVPATAKDAAGNVVTVQAPVFERVRSEDGSETLVPVKEHRVTALGAQFGSDAADSALGALAGTGTLGAGVACVAAWLLAAARQRRKDAADKNAALAAAEKNANARIVAERTKAEAASADAESEKAVADAVIDGVERAKSEIVRLAESDEYVSAEDLVALVNAALKNAQNDAGVREIVRSRLAELEGQGNG